MTVSSVTKTEFEVVNPAGKTIYTATERRLANKWAKDNAERLQSALKVEEVHTEVRVRRRKLYTHKPPAEAPVRAICIMNDGAMA